MRFFVRWNTRNARAADQVYSIRTALVYIAHIQVLLVFLLLLRFWYIPLAVVLPQQKGVELVVKLLDPDYLAASICCDTLTDIISGVVKEFRVINDCLAGLL